MRDVLRKIGGVLLCERPVPILLLISTVLASGYCLWLFDLAFLAGTSPAWDNPRGIVGRGWMDVATTLSGYTYFVRDGWRWPLFHVAKLGAPEGFNIIFTDSLPLVALVGRVVYRLTGHAVNLLGAWTGLCFLCSALACTGLVVRIGQRGIAATLAATIMALCQPALLARWGHVALMGQFEVVLALVYYVGCRRDWQPLRCFNWGVALCVLALWTQPYLFIMVFGLVAAAIGQAVLDRRTPPVQGIAVLGGLVATSVAIMLVSGHLAGTGALADSGFGGFSANLLSPVVPQLSGVFPSARTWMLDATGGQYEGFSYFGAGLLMLVLAALPWIGATVARGWRRHVCLLGVLLLFTVFALSNEIYIGIWHALSVPLPEAVLNLASVFRSSGRFIWPLLYCVMALAIVGTAALHGRFGALLLIAAVAVQWADTAPLRTALAASAAHPAPAPINLAAWRSAVARHSYVRVLPSFGCLTPGIPPSWRAEAAVTIQLLAARKDVATNTVFADRSSWPCDRERRLAAPGLLLPGELRVLLRTQAPSEDLRAGSCRATARMIVCSNTLRADDFPALLDVSAGIGE
jgi:hypothetical protein